MKQPKQIVKRTCDPAMLRLLLLLDIAALGVSGIMMSGFVFDFLLINGGRDAAYCDSQHGWMQIKSRLRNKRPISKNTEVIGYAYKTG